MSAQHGHMSHVNASVRASPSTLAAWRTFPRIIEPNQMLRRGMVEPMQQRRSWSPTLPAFLPNAQHGRKTDEQQMLQLSKQPQRPCVHSFLRLCSAIMKTATPLRDTVTPSCHVTYFKSFQNSNILCSYLICKFGNSRRV